MRCIMQIFTTYPGINYLYDNFDKEFIFTLYSHNNIILMIILNRKPITSQIYKQ